MNKEALIFLGVAIVVEVIATTALKSSDSFTRLIPQRYQYCRILYRILVSDHSNAQYSNRRDLCNLVRRWYCVDRYRGLVCARAKLDLPAMLGMGLIIAGVVTINLFSKSIGH